MSELTVLHPGDPGFAAATTGFQTAHPHRPDLVVDAAGPDDVRAAVRLALAGGRPWAVQSTGHGRATPLDGGVLVSTARMRDVTVDPAARTARIAAGARFSDVIAAAAPHGLAPVSGSSPHVGVVGYLLGGGFGILGRRFGWAADRVRAVEAVTGDGAAVRRTGPVPAGVAVTAVETELVPLRTLWGGTLSFPATPDVVTGFAAWTAGLPDDVTASLTLIPFPDVPGLPEPLRGRHVARATVVATADATARVAPLRALGPVLDERLRTVPVTQAHTIHADPTDPHAYAGEARLVSRLDGDLLAALPGLVGPASPVPSVVEIRQLGGALTRSATMPAAYREAAYLLRAVTALGPVTEEAARNAHKHLVTGHDLGRASTFAYGTTGI